MPEQHHCCAVCKRNDVRLYRYGGLFLRDEQIYCRAHAPAGHIEQQNLIPLYEHPDGWVYGNTSASDESIQRWEALPDAPTRGREG